MTGSLVVTGDDARPAHGARGGGASERRPGTGEGAETGTQAPLLAVSGLSVRYGPVHALQDVSLSVRSGELVALAGENGAGKTSLVRCIAGDVVPVAGEIYLGGQRVPPDPGVAARQGVAVVWQDLALCDNLDVAANILLGREPRRLLFSETRLHAAVRSQLAELRIPLKDTTRSVRSLSDGQRQLVAMARAMGSKPRLLVLDEPTASLGVKEAAQVEELIMGLREQGTTILLACHDIDQMFRLADRIVVLRQGRIVADLRPADTHPDDVVALLTGQEIDSSAAPPAHPAARAHRPPGLGRSGLQPEPDPVRARRGAVAASGCASTWSATGPCSAPRRSASLPASWSRGPGCRSARAAARLAWPRPTSARSSPTTCGSARPGGASVTWPRRSAWPARGRFPCSGRAGSAVSSRSSAPSTARRSATNSTWSTSTRAMPPARSSETGCSSR